MDALETTLLKRWEKLYFLTRARAVTFKDWHCGPRQKLRGVRGRRKALYASLTGIKRMRIVRFNQYVRLA